MTPEDLAVVRWKIAAALERQEVRAREVAAAASALLARAIRDMGRH